MDTEIQVRTESWPWRRKFSHCSCRDLNPRPFSDESGALTTELSLLSGCFLKCLFRKSYQISSVTLCLWVEVEQTGEGLLCRIRQTREGSVEHGISSDSSVSPFPFSCRCGLCITSPHGRKRSQLCIMDTSPLLITASQCIVLIYSEQFVIPACVWFACECECVLAVCLCKCI